MGGKFKDCFGNTYVNDGEKSHLIGTEKDPEYQTREQKLQGIIRYVSGAKDCGELTEEQKQTLHKYQEELFGMFMQNSKEILSDTRLNYDYEHARKNIEAAICYNGCNAMYPRSNIARLYSFPVSDAKLSDNQKSDTNK